MVESAWSLLPPIITIVLALATKEVYMSLIVGIFVGALMFTGFDLLAAIDYCELHTCDFNHELGEQNSQRI